MNSKQWNILDVQEVNKTLPNKNEMNTEKLLKVYNATK